MDHVRYAHIALIAGLACSAPAAAQTAGLYGGSVTKPTAGPCEAPLPGPPSPFTEEAAARGIVYHIGDPDTGYATGAMGSASFIDLDRDGDADIVCVGDWFGKVGVYENDGTGNFTDVSAGAPIVMSACGVTAADYDGDKDLDLFISTNPGEDVLLRNDGGFSFTDVTAQAGVGGGIGNGGSAAWADVNGDGWLDLYVTNRTGPMAGGGTSDVPNRLYINQGDGTLVDEYDTLGLTTGDAPTLVGAFIDFDLDGDPDLYEGNDKGAFCIERTNYLYENIGGTFVDITATSGTESCTDTMGIGIGDFDGNGYPDMYNTHTPAAPGNTLLMNNGDGTFTQDAAGYGVDSLALSWGCLFFDHDNDGDLALYVCNTFQQDRLYDFQGAWPAVDIAAQMDTIDEGKPYNVSSADIDLDGDLDLLIEIIPGDIKLLINHEGEKRNWISLKIHGMGSNQHAVGAIVRVRNGSQWQCAQVIAGGNNYRSQNEMPRHFGMNGACVADEIEVTWPDGATRTLTNYPVNARYGILRPNQLGDGDGEGESSIADLRELAKSFGPVRAGTEVYDIDGDGDVDLQDLTGLIRKIGG